MSSIPLSHIRSNLAETLRRAEYSSEPTLVSRRGQATAVILSLAQYQRLTQSNFSASLQNWRTKHLTSGRDDLHTVWDDIRDPAPGKEFSW